MIDEQQWEEERLRYGKRQRWLRWEYWSGYALYFPISFYNIFYLAVRYRGIFTFTAANPSIEDGGMINESKIEILELLKKADTEAVPNFLYLPMSESVETRLEKALKMVESGEMVYPCVLKPNAGQRGTGVVVIHNEEMMKDNILKMNEDHLLQAFCPGKEVSIFYYRYPDASEGKIFSITLKTLPKVVGDGESNLKKLILADDRHVCMAEFLFKLLQGRLTEVPNKGEEVVLNEIGAHCKGAMFKDGTDYAGEDLRARLDKVMSSEHGLCYGRFDVMVQSYDDLADGKNIKIIELNGVSSEATHIYDPKYSVFYAWKTLMKQWRIAYEIGFLQRKKGHPSSSTFKIFEQIFKYRKKVKSYSGVQ